MKQLKRILIVNPFGLGDCLFLSPVLRALKESGRIERTVLLVGSRTSELFQHHPFVDEVIPIDRDLLRSQNAWQNLSFLGRLISKLKRERFDAFIDVSLSREYAFFAQFFLNIPVRVGFNYHGRGRFLTHRLALPEGYRDKHVVEYYCDLLGPLGLKAPNPKMEIFLTDDELQSAQSKEPYTVLVPGGGESWGKDARFKRWPAAYFGSLLKLLADHLPSRRVIILGSAREQELGETAARELSGFHVENGMGQKTLRESLAVLSGASLVITNDGGLCHAASAANRPLIALFGPVDPVVYGPYPVSARSVVVRRTDLTCQPCYKSFRYNSACPTIECLNDLMPAQAAVMIKESGILNVKVS